MECPFCKGDIEEGVIKCKHCGEFIDKSGQKKKRKGTIFMVIGGLVMLLSFIMIIRISSNYSELDQARRSNGRSSSFYRSSSPFGSMIERDMKRAESALTFSLFVLASGAGLVFWGFRSKRKGAKLLKE